MSKSIKEQIAATKKQIFLTEQSTSQSVVVYVTQTLS